MNKKRMSAVFVALLMWGLASPVSAQDAEPRFNSSADDVAKIRGILEEYRQDIIRKDGYAITKLVLNHNVLFHHINTEDREVVGNRLNGDRLSFVQTFVFPRSYADLLSVRNAKKEQEAYNEQVKNEAGWESDAEDDLNLLRLVRTAFREILRSHGKRG